MGGNNGQGLACKSAQQQEHPKDLAADVFLPPLPSRTPRRAVAVASGPMRLNAEYLTLQRRALESFVRMNRSLRTRRIEKPTNFDSTDK
eukprot:scaffold1970_cov78-Skeletonema_dohrnii-CCMP3373.AAC.2